MPSRRMAIATLLLAGAGAACRSAPDVPSAGPSLDDLAERYVRLTLRLSQHQPSLVETWLGPEEWRPGPRAPVAKIREDIGDAVAALAEIASQAAQSDRHQYLEGQLNGLLTAARRLAGESLPFFDEARAGLGVGDTHALVRSAGLPRPERDTTHPSRRESRDASVVAAAHAELERRISGSSTRGRSRRTGRGTLHERYAAFRVRHALSPERVQPTFRAAIETCRDRVLSHVPLPETERIELETATGLGLEARAIYVGDFRTRVTIDASGPTDIARLVWLAAHETYPGHHVQHVLADRDCVRTRGWRERALHPAFGRHVLCAEGAAETGAALLLDGHAFEEVCGRLATLAGVPARTVPDLVAVHRAVADLDAVIPAIARAYLDGEMSSDVAAEQLTADALVVDSRQFLSVIERQRTKLLAYPLGRRMIDAEVFGAPVEQRWQRLALIATTLISRS